MRILQIEFTQPENDLRLIIADKYIREPRWRLHYPVTYASRIRVQRLLNEHLTRVGIYTGYINVYINMEKL